MQRVAQPAWAPVDRLAAAADRDVAKGWVRSLGFCTQNLADCQGWSDLGAVLIRIGRPGGDILALRTASHGTCGPYEFAILGPAGADGRRALRDGEETLFDACGEALAIAPRPGLPDLVTTAFVDRSGPRGPALETTRWRWAKGHYVAAGRAREYPTVGR